MQHRLQIGDGGVQAAVAQSALGEIVAAFAAHIADDASAARAMVGSLRQALSQTSPSLPVKPERAQPGDVRPLVRRQHALAQTERAHALHLRQPLQRRFARPRDGVAIAFGGEIAFGKARVIVRRADEAVEIDLFRAHSGRPGAGMDAAFSESCVATG